MKVTFILSAFPKLSETFVLSQITGLIDRGVDVRIVAGKPTEETCVHGDFETYDLANRVTYVFPEVGKAKGNLLREFSTNTLQAIRCFAPWKYGRKAINGNLQAWARTFKSVEQNSPSDAVIAHFGGMGDLIACVKQAGAFNAPIAVVFHGWDIAVPLYQGKPLYPRLQKWADGFLPISDRWKNALSKHGFPKDRITVHRVGVQVPSELPSRCISSPPKLLSVCRFVEKKGLEFALKAVGKLIAEGHDMQYTIVGSGPLENELRSLAETLEITKHVDFTGPLPKAEVREAMMNHDIFVAPSVTASSGDQEGIPTAIMESMSLGMLVASTNHSGIPELVHHGVNGLLAAEKDVDGLARNILQLAQDTDSTADFRQAGYAHVHDCFNIESLNDRLKQLLGSLGKKSS